MNQDDRSLEGRDTAGATGAAPMPLELAAAQEGGAVLADDALVIVPVRNMVLFPGLIMPIAIGRESSIAAAQYAVKHELPVGILMQTRPEADRPGPDDLARVGTIASILRYVSTPDGTHHIICQGQQRFRVIDFVAGHAFTAARFERIDESGVVPDKEIEARFLRLKEQ